MHSYLKQILDKKKQEVAALHTNEALTSARNIKFNYTGAFKAALQTDGLSVIAEVKRKSPSKGALATITDPIDLAERYAQGGASAISVLTDAFGFNGSIEDLALIAAHVSCPVLRKDFVIDELQLVEATMRGASAALLIVAVLGDKTAKFIQSCHRFGLDALVEVHNKDELAIAIDAQADIIGVNNRNLETFEVDINNALDLYPAIPSEAVTIAESGIADAHIAQQFKTCGYDAVLIGEALVRSDDPSQFIHQLRERGNDNTA
ncbi:MAG: indole-3-glycerol phosphate synthase [Coxiella sp. (in: Bacteria)]|nr:MAG: indole-3-glycerol phosphate synthase [Coxiella sp. (in: g-proteobacteria)]